MRRRSAAGYGRLTIRQERHSRASSSSLISPLVAPTTARAAVNGGLKQLSGTTGCHSGAATTPSGCTAVRGLGNDTGDAVITKDGKNVYVASVEKDAIVAFSRNLTNGRLTQKSSITGCFTSNPAFAVPNPDGCNLATADTNALDQVAGLAVSDGGSSLYATTQRGRISTFKRDTDDGTLTYVGLFNLSGSTGSKSLPAVTVSPDSKNVYTAGPGGWGGILWWFARDTSGTSTHGNLSGFNCVATTDVCTPPLVPNLGGSPSDLEVTPDNKQVIVASGESNVAVIGFDRNLSTGAPNPTTANTTARCITGGTLANCATRSGQDYPRGISIANNRDIYVAGYYALTSVQRNATTNALSPAPSPSFCSTYPNAGFAGCVEQRSCDVICGGRGIFAGPDGKNIYTGSDNGAVNTFARAATGAFSPNATALGCLSTSAVTGCNPLRPGTGVRNVIGDSGNRTSTSAGDARLLSFTRLTVAPVCQNVSCRHGEHGRGERSPSAASDPDGDVRDLREAHVDLSRATWPASRATP